MTVLAAAADRPVTDVVPSPLAGPNAEVVYGADDDRQKRIDEIGSVMI